MYSHRQQQIDELDELEEELVLELSEDDDELEELELELLLGGGGLEDELGELDELDDGDDELGELEEDGELEDDDEDEDDGLELELDELLELELELELELPFLQQHIRVGILSLDATSIYRAPIYLTSSVDLLNCPDPRKTDFFGSQIENTWAQVDNSSR